MLNTTLFWQILAIFCGGGLGASLRWLLSLKFNQAWPSFQTGTLLANLIGCFIIGLAVAFFAFRPNLLPVVRLFLITGLLGGLTTFSTFSSEVVQLLERGHIGTGLAVVAGNLFGSLALTAAGLALGKLFLFRS